MEANNAHAPSNANAIKMVNLTDYTFTISQLGGEKVTRTIQFIPHSSYFIIKEIDWDKDPHVAQFITKYIIEQEVIRRLERPEYVILEVPAEYRRLVRETLKGIDVKVLYVKTTAVETKDGVVQNVRSVEEETTEPKVILNLTNLDFTDRQIREVYNEDYELLYPSEPLEFEAEGDIIPVEYLNHFGKLIQNEINKCLGDPDCVIVDVPENIVSYIARMFSDTNIRFIYTRTVFVETVDNDPFKVKLLSKVEE